MAGDAIMVAVEHPGVEEGVQVDEDAVLAGMIPWVVIGTGCMAIRLMTIPAPVTCR